MDAPELADFDVAEIGDAVAAAKQKNNAYVRIQLEKRAQALEERGEQRRAHALALLAYLCRPPLVDVRTDDPFEVKTNLPAIRDAEVAVLTALAPKLPPVLRARIREVIWAVTGDVRAALFAAADYLDGITSGPVVEMYQLRQIGRGLFLLHRFGQRQLLQETLTQLEAFVIEWAEKQPLGWVAHVMKSMQYVSTKAQPPRFSAVAGAAEAAAGKAEANSMYKVARNLWDAAAGWHHLQGDEARVQEARRRAGETYALEAHAAAGGLVGASRAAHFTKEAITHLRALGGSQRSRVDELRRELQRHQQASLEELVPYGASVDAAPLREGAIAAVRGKTVEDALRTLAHLLEIPVHAELREYVVESAKEMPLQALLNRQVLDAQGRTMAKREGLRPDSPPEVVDQHAREPANAQHNGFGALVIEPALSQIRVEHNLTSEEALRSCTNLIATTTFCAPVRQSLYARALAAGIMGDFVLSTHLLVPQIEESIRHLLRNAGHLTSGLTDEQIELEHGLGSILGRPETLALLGEDAAFDLQGLLIEHLGSNIRNRNAHGLIDPAQFEAPAMRYLWWLSLRLLLDRTAPGPEAELDPNAPG